MNFGEYEISVPNVLIATVVLLVLLFLLRTLKHIVTFLFALALVLALAYLWVGDLDFLLEFFVNAKKELPRRIR